MDQDFHVVIEMLAPVGVADVEGYSAWNSSVPTSSLHAAPSGKRRNAEELAKT